MSLNRNVVGPTDTGDRREPQRTASVAVSNPGVRCKIPLSTGCTPSNPFPRGVNTSAYFQFLVGGSISSYGTKHLPSLTVGKKKPSFIC
jgi:hypothetical protein